MIPKPRVYAWAYDCDTQDILLMLSKWNNKLGAILYSNAYEVAMRPGHFIAFCGSLGDADKVVDMVKKGAHFDALIYLDEENLNMKLQDYIDSANRVNAKIASTSIPFWGMSTMGIGDTPDYAFLQQEVAQIDVPVICWNSSGTKETITTDLKRLKTPWFLSPHPWRFTIWPLFNSGWLNWIYDHLAGRTASWYAKTIANRSDVEAVGIWCLRAYEEGHFGLHTKKNRLTLLGRAVRRVLK